jgi:hypothetical protein
MLIQKDHWMMKEPRQKGVYRGDIAERLGVHPGTASQRSVSGRLAHGPTRRSPVCANLALAKTQPIPPPVASCASGWRVGCS